MGVWRGEMGLRGPGAPCPGGPQHMPGPPPKSAGVSMLPAPAMWLGQGPGCRRPSGPWAVGPNSPCRLAPACRAGPRSLGIPSRARVPQGAMGCRGQPPVRVGGVPTVQWGPGAGVADPGVLGRPMWPAPLASGGLALGEVTCGGWGPQLQYSFFIRLATPTHRPSHATLIPTHR